MCSDYTISNALSNHFSCFQSFPTEPDSGKRTSSVVVILLLLSLFSTPNRQFLLCCYVMLLLCFISVIVCDPIHTWQHGRIVITWEWISGNLAIWSREYCRIEFPHIILTEWVQPSQASIHQVAIIAGMHTTKMYTELAWYTNWHDFIPHVSHFLLHASSTHTLHSLFSTFLLPSLSVSLLPHCVSRHPLRPSWLARDDNITYLEGRCVKHSKTRLQRSFV